MYSRLLIFPVLLQVICIIHLFKSDRERWWIYIILFIPFAGSIAYILVEMVPSFMQSRKMAAFRESAATSMFIKKRIRQLEDQVEFSSTFNNKKALADAYFQDGRYDMAVEMYDSCRNGIHADDTAVMRRMAEAHFNTGRYDKAREILEEMREAEGGFSDNRAWLFYVVVLEKTGDREETLAEFEKLLQNSASIEARCRFGLFLRGIGRLDEAKQQFAAAVKDSKVMPKFSRREQKKWINLAVKELNALP